ncbi:MAG: ABC transporter permease [Paracoccaceae bacterium]|jgi:ribose transport system permease protein
MDQPASATSALSLKDKAILAMVRFFRAEWSGAFLAILILAISIELSTSGRPFFHPTNLMTILNNSAAIGVVAGGMTLVILTSGIDLSVGSVMGMTAALTGYVASFWGFPPFLAIMTGLGIGLMVGAFNGTLIAYLGMPAFIVTLAGLSIWRGTGHLTTSAQATPKLPETFDYFGRHNPFSGLREAYKSGDAEGWVASVGGFIDANWINFFRTFQMSMLIFIAFFILVGIIVANTRYGRYVYAIGSGVSGARQAGINTPQYTLMTYMFCSFAAALGALLFLGRAPYAKSDYGQMWELDAIAAVVIGGTSLFGGRGSLWGTFMGVILLKLINNGLTLAQLDTFWQMVVTGLIILIAVGLDIVRQSRDAEAVRKLLSAIAAVMAFLTAMTPGAIFLRAKIALWEHSSAEALRDSGTKLAPGHNARLLSDTDLNAFQNAASANAWPFFMFMALTLCALFLITRHSYAITLSLTALFGFAVVQVFTMGYEISAPFLFLGIIAILASSQVHSIFERARALGTMAI